MKVKSRRWALNNIVEFNLKPTSRDYIRVILIVGSLFSLYEASPYIFGEGGRQLILIFQSTLPIVAFAVIFRSFLKGEASTFDKILILLFLALRFISGMSSGWLGSVAFIIIICAAIYLEERRRIPRSAVILIIVSVLFFQAGKENFRKTYWYGDEQGSKIERISFWVDESFTAWMHALDAPPGRSVSDLTYLSLSRVSLLTQTANVVDLTPTVVPFQYGRLYSYMAVTLIPRFVWPDKPSINEANQFYQLAYDISSENELAGVSISVGVLTESYINFGWPGIFLIMFLIGLFFNLFQEIFLSPNSSILLKAIGVALLPSLLSIEAQLAAYVGGLAQQIFLVLLVMLPVIRFQHKSRRAKMQASLARV